MSTPHKQQQTTEDFINKFDHFRRVPDTGNVIIHPHTPYGFIELTGDFVDELKDTMAKRCAMAHAKVDELNAIEKFAIMLLEDAY